MKFFAAAAFLALALAGSAAAMRMDVTHSPAAMTVETDGPPPTDTTTTTEAACPSTAVSPDPNPACPPEPYDVDDQGGPVPCNYYSGIPDQPCPHADSTYFVVRCVGPDSDGDINMIWRISRTTAEPGIDDADTKCPGGYVVLDP